MTTKVTWALTVRHSLQDLEAFEKVCAPLDKVHNVIIDGMFFLTEPKLERHLGVDFLEELLCQQKIALLEAQRTTSEALKYIETGRFHPCFNSVFIDLTVDGSADLHSVIKEVAKYPNLVLKKIQYTLL